jgi:hypothetical protein
MEELLPRLEGLLAFMRGRSASSSRRAPARSKRSSPSRAPRRSEKSRHFRVRLRQRPRRGDDLPMRCRMASGARLSDPKGEAPYRNMPQRTRTTRHPIGTMRILRVRCGAVTLRCDINRRRCRVVRRDAATDGSIAALSGDNVTLILETPHRFGTTRHCSHAMRHRRRRYRKRSIGCRVVSIRRGI